jgi:hypothetical protein
MNLETPVYVYLPFFPWLIAVFLSLERFVSSCQENAELSDPVQQQNTQLAITSGRSPPLNAF